MELGTVHCAMYNINLVHADKIMHVSFYYQELGQHSWSSHYATGWMIQSLMVRRVKTHNIFSLLQNVQAISGAHPAF